MDEKDSKFDPLLAGYLAYRMVRQEEDDMSQPTPSQPPINVAFDAVLWCIAIILALVLL